MDLLSDPKVRAKLVEASLYQGIPLFWFITPFLRSSRIPKQSIFTRSFFLQTVYDFSTMLACRAVTKRTSKKGLKRKKILFTGQNVEWKTIIDPVSKRARKTDAFFDSLIVWLQKEDNYCFVSTHPLADPVSGLRIIVEKKVGWDIVHKPFNNYWSMRAWAEARKVRKRSGVLEGSDAWLSLVSGKSTVSGLDAADVSRSFKDSFGKAVKFVVMAEKLIEQEKPDLVLVQDEYGLWERSLIVAAKSRRIPVLAVQHGIIHAYHPGYLHWDDEFSEGSRLQNITLPDKLAVYGVYSKDTLVNLCKYPEDGIVVTGEPRYDVLADPRFLSKNDFMVKYALDGKKKVALLITQGAAMSSAFLRSVVRAFKNLPDVQVVIKPHPGDFLSGWHQRILEEEGYSATILDSRANTFEALFASDVVLTVTSTTAIEAMILDKPVVIVNLTGKPDPMPYVESGAAVGAYGEKDVTPAIKSALFDRNLLKELAPCRKNFLNGHVYKVGHANENVAQLIKSMITND